MPPQSMAKHTPSPGATMSPQGTYFSFLLTSHYSSYHVYMMCLWPIFGKKLFKLEHLNRNVFSQNKMSTIIIAIFPSKKSNALC